MKRYAIVAWLVAALVAVPGSRAAAAQEQRSSAVPASSGEHRIVFLVRHAAPLLNKTRVTRR